MIRTIFFRIKQLITSNFSLNTRDNAPKQKFYSNFGAMFRQFVIYIILALLAVDCAFAQSDSPATRLVSLDSLNLESVERNRRLYDSLAVKSGRHRVSKLLYDLFVTEPVSQAEIAGKAIDESKRFARYEGKTIGTIDLVRNNVFRENGNWFQRAGNKIHITTRERIIRRDILFDSGDKIDPNLMVRNEQILKSRPYISNATILLTPDPQDSTVVNISVVTRDSWTISLDADLSSDGETMLGVYDANIFGTGNRLEVQTNFNRQSFDYGGNVVLFEMPNMFGSFFQLDLAAGRTFDNSEATLSIVKEFIKPTDYELGASFNRIKSDKTLIDEDIAIKVRDLHFDLWAGVSHLIPKIESSIYLSGSYGLGRFPLRPDVTRTMNPIFHNYDNLLVGIGLYREKFMTTNLVYGFGSKEYIAVGYKAEIVSGYTWGEFENSTYLGLSWRSGHFTKIGYFSGGLTLGSHINSHSGAWNRSAVDFDLRWFSNLYRVHKCHVRQFTALNYTHGWNRYQGNDESIDFSGSNALRMLDDNAYGINRMVWNNETVVFTPWQPLGFRIAFVGFVDIGLIGRDHNMFKNQFFSTIGVGVRIKNERLIFKTITLRFGVALGKGGLIDSDYYQLTNSAVIRQFRYQPTRPEIVEFD